RFASAHAVVEFCRLGERVAQWRAARRIGRLVGRGARFAIAARLSMGGRSRTYFWQSGPRERICIGSRTIEIHNRRERLGLLARVVCRSTVTSQLFAASEHARRAGASFSEGAGSRSSRKNDRRWLARAMFHLLPRLYEWRTARS